MLKSNCVVSLSPSFLVLGTCMITSNSREFIHQIGNLGMLLRLDCANAAGRGASTAIEPRIVRIESGQLSPIRPQRAPLYSCPSTPRPLCSRLQPTDTPKLSWVSDRHVFISKWTRYVGTTDVYPLPESLNFAIPLELQLHLKAPNIIMNRSNIGTNDVTSSVH